MILLRYVGDVGGLVAFAARYWKVLYGKAFWTRFNEAQGTSRKEGAWMNTG